MPTEAVEIADWLMVSGLEGPTDSEALFAGRALADVIALGATLDDLDPGAAAGIAFLFERIRTTFTGPALASGSREELLALWEKVAWPVLRSMDAVLVCLHEATQAHPSDLIARRLVHADRRAVADVGRKLEAVGGSLGKQLSETQALIERSRAVLEQRRDEGISIDPRSIKLFHQGTLLWLIGFHLCAEAAERSTSLVNDLRSDFAVDVIEEFAAAGARLTAVTAMFLAGLGFDAEGFERSLWADTHFVDFMLEVTQQIPRAFGPDVRYQLGMFRYPDEPDAWELHVTIDAAIGPEQACERLDRLCDEWWDSATTNLSVAIYPVLGVVEDG